MFVLFCCFKWNALQKTKKDVVIICMHVSKSNSKIIHIQCSTGYDQNAPFCARKKNGLPWFSCFNLSIWNPEIVNTLGWYPTHDLRNGSPLLYQVSSFAGFIKTKAIMFVCYFFCDFLPVVVFVVVVVFLIYFRVRKLKIGTYLIMIHY